MEMDHFRQDLIEAVIFGGAQTALLIADALDRDNEEVYEALRALKREGIVRNPPGGDEWGPEPVEGWDEWMVTHAHLYSKWSYCGGAVSAFFAASQMAVSRC